MPSDATACLGLCVRHCSSPQRALQGERPGPVGRSCAAAHAVAKRCAAVMPCTRDGGMTFGTCEPVLGVRRLTLTILRPEMMSA